MYIEVQRYVSRGGEVEVDVIACRTRREEDVARCKMAGSMRAAVKGYT